MVSPLFSLRLPNNMALFVIRKYFKQSIVQNHLYSVYLKNNKIKLKEVDYGSIRLQFKYHTTPTVFNYKPEKKHEIRIKLKRKLLSKVVSVWPNMTVTDLAIKCKVSTEKIISILSEIDQKPYQHDSAISDPSIAKQITDNLGRESKIVTQNAIQANIIDTTNYQVDQVLKRDPSKPSSLVRRHPIITIMGHVDHGKTTLLDYLRKSSVAKYEFGGITQHIGAFEVTLGDNEKITFLDTPGHAAFNSMRERGANVTDIVLLVIAADDGVMEQTVESIKMAQETDVSIIVVVNKIDKPNVDIEGTLDMLATYGVIVESRGGNVQSVNISARNGTNVDKLIDVILTQAEIMNLKGDPTGFVEGVIIESTTDVYLGKVVSLAIQRGTLKKGNVLVSDESMAKVRSIFDHTGSMLNEAKLSQVVRVTGWQNLPIVGKKVFGVKNEKEAQMIIKNYMRKVNANKSVEQKKVADLKYVNHLVDYKTCIEKQAQGYFGFDSKINYETKSDSLKLNIIIKSDVSGSLEAIMDVIQTYEDKRCLLTVISNSVGPITKTDLEFARTFNALIYCFNIPVSKSTLKEAENITILQWNVIYQLIDDIKDRLTKQLPLKTEPEEIGKGIILKEIEITDKNKKIKVAGCRCTNGLLKKNAIFKILRGDEVIYDDKICEMKHFKNNVESLSPNTEGGLRLNINEISLMPDDVIICYNNVKRTQYINWDPGF